MESINVEKIHALKKYKQQQFVNTLLLYPLVALTLGIFCTSPFWFPSTKTFICVSIPRILSLFFSAQSLFILGNLIVIFLVRESKVRPSNSSYNNNNNNDSQVKKDIARSRSKEVKKYTVIPSISKEVVFERPFGSEVVGFSSNGRINGIGYEKEIAKNSDLPEFEEEEKEEEVEEEPLWHEGRRENLREERNEMGGNGSEDLDNGGWELVIPSFSTDELKRRADDFIAKVNNQIRLEAEECLAFAS